MEILLVLFAIALPSIVGLLVMVVLMMSGNRRTCTPETIKMQRLQDELSARYAADAERQREIHCLRQKLREVSYGLAYFKNPNYWGGDENRWFWLGSGQTGPWNLFDDFAPQGEAKVMPLNHGNDSGRHVDHK